MKTQSLSYGSVGSRQRVAVRLGICLLAVAVFGSILLNASVWPNARGQESQGTPALQPLSAEAIQQRLQQGMPVEAAAAADLTAAGQAIHALAPTDWLGPLAPISLSPFFGITCLSGLALWGPDWLPAGSLLAKATPLQNPTLFWTFLVLTLLTSLPRFTKVSKPIAFATDQLEAYAAIITLLVIRYLVMDHSNSSAPVAGTPQLVLQAGVFSFSLELFFYLAMVINILVVNSVKFFFEFMIWLTPIPFLDACFEVANKTVCALLVAIYAYSPTLATVLNLLLFAACLLIWRWSYRHLRYYRHMAFDAIWPRIQSGYGVPGEPQLVVFSQHSWQGFAARTRFTLQRQGDGWLLRQQRFLRSPVERTLPPASFLLVQPGWLTNSLTVVIPQQVQVAPGGTVPISASDSDLPPGQVDFSFSRRYQRQLAELARLMEAAV